MTIKRKRQSVTDHVDDSTGATRDAEKRPKHDHHSASALSPQRGPTLTGRHDCNSQRPFVPEPGAATSSMADMDPAFLRAQAPPGLSSKQRKRWVQRRLKRAKERSASQQSIPQPPVAVIPLRSKSVAPSANMQKSHDRVLKRADRQLLRLVTSTRLMIPPKKQWVNVGGLTVEPEDRPENAQGYQALMQPSQSCALPVTLQVPKRVDHERQLHELGLLQKAEAPPATEQREAKNFMHRKRIADSHRDCEPEEARTNGAESSGSASSSVVHSDSTDDENDRARCTSSVRPSEEASATSHRDVTSQEQASAATQSLSREANDAEKPSTHRRIVASSRFKSRQWAGLGITSSVASRTDAQTAFSRFSAFLASHTGDSSSDGGNESDESSDESEDQPSPRRANGSWHDLMPETLVQEVRMSPDVDHHAARLEDVDQSADLRDSIANGVASSIVDPMKKAKYSSIVNSSPARTEASQAEAKVESDDTESSASSDARPSQVSFTPINPRDATLSPDASLVIVQKELKVQYAWQSDQVEVKSRRRLVFSTPSTTRSALASLLSPDLVRIQERVDTQLRGESEKADIELAVNSDESEENGSNISTSDHRAGDQGSNHPVAPILSQHEIEAGSNSICETTNGLPSFARIASLPQTPTDSDEDSTTRPVAGIVASGLVNNEKRTESSFLGVPLTGGVGSGRAQHNGTALLSSSTPGSYFTAIDEDAIANDVDDVMEDVFSLTRPLESKLLHEPKDDRRDSLLTNVSSIRILKAEGVQRRVLKEVMIPVNSPSSFGEVIQCYTVHVTGGEAMARSSSTSSLSELGSSPSPPVELSRSIELQPQPPDEGEESEHPPPGAASARSVVLKKRRMTGRTSKHFSPDKGVKRRKSGIDVDAVGPAQASNDVEVNESASAVQDVGSPVKKTPKPKKKSTGTKSDHFLPFHLLDRVDLPTPTKGRVPAGTSRAPVPPITSERFGIIQEKLWEQPFWLLIAVTFLNKTAGRAAVPTFWKLKERWPTPEALAQADRQEVHDMIQHLGLQNQRTKRMVLMAEAWVADPPVVGKRYKTVNYPVHGDHREHKKLKIIEEDAVDCKGALEIGHIPGCGAYAWDSWRIFCRDALRGVAEDYNGKGAKGEEFQPEWKRVLPLDKELRATLRWMWLREGWIWDHETGEKRRATEEEMEMARHGEMNVPDVQEKKFAAQAAGIVADCNSNLGEEVHTTARDTVE